MPLSSNSAVTRKICFRADSWFYLLVFCLAAGLLARPTRVIAADPPSGWVNVTANLAGMPSDCGTLAYLSAKPDQDMLIACVGQQGYWASTDGAATWVQLGKGTGSATVTHKTTSIVYDPTAPNTFWESGIYGNLESYKTNNNGQTFVALPISGVPAAVQYAFHNDSISVDLTDPARKTILLGSHEAAQKVIRSTDSGLTWVNIGANVSSQLASTMVLVLDAQTYLLGCTDTNAAAIFRTTNSGQTWAQVSSLGGIGTPLRASDGRIYWLASDGMLRSDDQGQTWTLVTGTGVLKAQAAYYGTPPIELPNGKIAALGKNSEIVVSADRGATWTAVTTALPYTRTLFNPKLVYSSFRKAFYFSNASCDNQVPADAVLRYGYDATVSSTNPTRPSAMPLISRNKPAFASGSGGNTLPSAANDSNHQSLWVSSGGLPAWIAYDLSTVPVAQRQQVLVAWYGPSALGYINPSPSAFLKLPVDYTIEINPAAGGGNSAPTSGWQVVVTVTGNNRSSRQHLINLAGANWVRLRATAGSDPTLIGIDLNVHSAPDGASDCWLFMGDSITGALSYLFSDVPGEVNKLAPNRWPSTSPAGVGGANVFSANDYIDETLSTFPGRFVTLNYGTNAGSAGFSAAMEILIQKVFVAGKIPVIPHIPWSDIPEWLVKGPEINAQIDALYIKYPSMLRGPDLWTALQGRYDLISPNEIHPNGAGNEEIARQWALAMTANSSTPPPPAPVAVSLTPASASVGLKDARQFTATVTGSTNTAVTWSIQEGSTGGTISLSGLYTAPATAGTFHVKATSGADNTKSASATVTAAILPPSSAIVSFTVTDYIPEVVAVSLAPSSVSVTTGATSQFTASVTGSTNSTVTWSVQEGSTGGTVSSAGLYTAPSTAGTYHVVATSNADTSKSASASVTVTAISIPIAPAIASFTASPSTISAGSSTTLAWSTTGATGLSITPGVGTVTGTSTTISPTTTTTYTLTATRGTANVMQSVTVTVTPVSATAPVINSFTIDSASLATTGMCTLSWNVTGTASLSISPNVGSVSGNSIAVSPLATTTYTLTAANSSGTVTATANVTLNTPVLTLEAAPVLKIKRDDHVATIEMDFDESAWAQLWTVGTAGREGCGYRVQWWADATAISTILATDGCSTENSGGASSGTPNMSAPRQLVTPNRIIQIQPLANNVLYHVSVVRLNGLGQICSPTTEMTFNGGDGTRVAALRSSMTFFDDFNLPMGAPDERKWNNASTSQTDPRFNMFFVNEQCHVHTLTGTLNHAAGDKAQTAQRARKPIAIETGVRRRIVFDMDGIFSPRSVWYLDLNPIQTDVTAHMSFFDTDGDKGLPAGVLRLKANNHSLSVHLIDDSGASYKIAEVTLYDKGRKMSSNVRRSFDVRLGTDGIQIFCDGTSVIDTMFAPKALRAGTYELLWSTIGYNTSKDNNPYFLSHWDNFGFDGPDLEPRAVHNYVTQIEGTDYQKASAGNNSRPTFTVNIPDDIHPTAAGATSEAWLVYTYNANDYSSLTLQAGDHVLVNGSTSFPLPAQLNNSSPLDPALVAWYAPGTIRIKLGQVQQGGVSPLQIGNNTFQFFAANAGIIDVHVEVFCPQYAEPPYTPPSALHRVPMHAELPKLGPPASIVFINGEDLVQVAEGDIHGKSNLAGKTSVEVVVGNSNYANWAPQWLNMPANSTEIWSSGGTTGIKSVELFLRRKGTTGYGDRIAVLMTARDAPAPQVRYVFNFDTRSYANGDYELYVLGTTNTGLKSHPTFYGSAFRWDPTEWAGAYEPVSITISN